MKHGPSTELQARLIEVEPEGREADLRVELLISDNSSEGWQWVAEVPAEHADGFAALLKDAKVYMEES